MSEEFQYNGICDSDIYHIIDEIIDEVVLGLCFEMHRACKKAFIFLDEMDVESQKRYGILDIKGCDVFGASAQNKKLECICPNCLRAVAASRFAPHLEKCLEMTQDAIKITSKRPLVFKTSREEDNQLST